jgi:DNA (cytosine-5)-methyltransferase 1
MRPPQIRAAFDILPGEIAVDHFAGGGGAGEGVRRAIGRPVNIAINHSEEAVAMYRANHPETRTFCQNIWEVDPVVACGSNKVGVLWASPACTHFSRAKGSANPLSAKIRSLAWVVTRWAKAVRPRIIFMENVEEWEDWGPLDADGRPDPTKLGRTFRQWLGRLRALGYAVEHRLLVAADYGTPTTRKRLFLIARCDGRPIVWPEPTHGRGRRESWKPASSIIDWSLPCPSIFDRQRPLAEATLNRIAAGIRRYVIDSPEPFIVGAGGPSYSGKPVSIGRPLGTVLPDNHRALVSPYVLPLRHQDTSQRCRALDGPLPTITASNRGELALATPFLVRHGHYSTITGAGLEEGCGAGTFRGQPLGSPLATVCATNDKHLVAPIVVKHYGGVVGHRVDRPLGTVTAVDHHSVAAAFLTKMYGTSTGAPVQLPLPTVTANGKGGGHLAEVRAFLVRYYSCGGRASAGQQLGLPLGTVTSRDRFGLVMIHGEPWEIVDIGMRMLAPHELFAAQGFPSDYDIAPEFNGKPLTKTAQIALAGNSVCVDVAEAIVAANTRAAA